MGEKNRNDVRTAQADWENRCLDPFQKANPERLPRFPGGLRGLLGPGDVLDFTAESTELEEIFWRRKT